MARKPMRSQLNQIRAWVRQGRTDAWIAHQLEISASELRDFIRRNNLSADEDAPSDDDLRDEIEAEIEAAMESEEDEEEEDEADEGDEADEDEDEDAGEPEGPGEQKRPRSRQRRTESTDGEGEGQRPRRRRRRRRGPKRAGAGLEATFDHGEKDGFGLWLDPAVEGDPVYSEHWKGHRRLEVTIEPEQIVIRRSGGD
jgi:hypothetical protein